MQETRFTNRFQHNLALAASKNLLANPCPARGIPGNERSHDLSNAANLDETVAFLLVEVANSSTEHALFTTATAAWAWDAEQDSNAVRRGFKNLTEWP